MMNIDFSKTDGQFLAAQDSQILTDWEAEIWAFVKQWNDGSVSSYAARTSGSTGSPKTMYHSKSAMIASARRTCDFFGLKAGDKALLTLPVTQIGGKMMVVRAMICGMVLQCVRPTTNALSEVPPLSSIDFGAFTPMQMTVMLSDESSRMKLQSIRKIILGGGEVHESLVVQLQSLNAAVYETYGMTETISHIALKRLNGDSVEDAFTLMPGISMRRDERDCLVLTIPDQSEGEIITNDVVEMRGEKQFIWKGRYDNVINTGGVKVQAEDIERKLKNVVREAYAIAGAADATLGQKVTLVIETDKNRDAIAADYQSIINECLSKYERPRLILCVSNLPMTASGKLNRAALNELVREAVRTEDK